MNSWMRRDLPTPGSPTSGHDLTMARISEIKCMPQLLDLFAASDETRQSVPRQRLKSRNGNGTQAIRKTARAVSAP